jgi:hypothetical protein
MRGLYVDKRADSSLKVSPLLVDFLSWLNWMDCFLRSAENKLDTPKSDNFKLPYQIVTNTINQY